MVRILLEITYKSNKLGIGPIHQSDSAHLASEMGWNFEINAFIVIIQ